MPEPFLINHRNVVITGRLLTVARIEQELCDDIGDPTEITEALKQNSVNADIFTFCQRLPETTPRYPYYMEWEDIAVLPVKSYDHWWSHQIKTPTRGKVRKAEKQGVVVRDAEFNDEFIKGMVNIFNETPIRQGRPFWHYGKDFETVKREFSRYLFREEVIGAYYQGELIGFIMLAHVEPCAIFGQIISKIKHRDKAPTNALMAKAVDNCARHNLPYLVYARWDKGSSLTYFKHENGFQKVSLPRYYLPLTAKGKLALALRLHRGLADLIPAGMRPPLKQLRSVWYAKVQTLKD
jgi:hypothetical protein